MSTFRKVCNRSHVLRMANTYRDDVDHCDACKSLSKIAYEVAAGELKVPHKFPVVCIEDYVPYRPILDLIERKKDALRSGHLLPDFDTNREIDLALESLRVLAKRKWRGVQDSVDQWKTIKKKAASPPRRRTTHNSNKEIFGLTDANQLSRK